MSEYSEAYGATINFLSQFDPVYQLKEALGKAKDAEKFIADTQAEIDKLETEADKLKSDNQAAHAEIASIKATRAGIHDRAIERLNDDIEEKQKTAALNAENAEQAASNRLAGIEDRTTEAIAREQAARQRAESAERDLKEVTSALAASERERKEAIAALHAI